MTPDTPASAPAAALRRARLLEDLAFDLAVAQTPNEVCAVAGEHARVAADARGVMVWFLDDAFGTRFEASNGELEGQIVSPPDLAGFAQASVEDPLNTPLWATPDLLSEIRAGREGSVRTATLRAGGAVIGGLAIFSRSRPADQDAGLLATVVRTVGEALGRANAMVDSQRLAAIVNSSDDAMVRTAVDGTLLSWNGAAERTMGYTAAEAIGRNIADLILPDDRLDPASATALERIRAGGGAQRVVAPRRHKDGRILEMAITMSPIRADDGQTTGIAVTARDITDRLQANERVRRLAAVVEAAPLAAMVIELDGTVVECNLAAQDLLERDPPHIIGRHLTSLAQDHERLESAFVQARSGRSTDPRVLQWRRTDGTTRRLQVSLFPVLGEDGRPSAIVLSAVDITESSDMAEALEQARSLESLGRLAGGIAHDFNNILAIISLSAQAVRAEVGDRAGGEALSDLITATARGQRLVRQLLTFSRHQPVAAERLDLATVVTDLAPMLQTLTGPMINLNCEAESGLPAIRSDLASIEQVVVNLVLNARDAMPDGGALAVQVAADPNAVVLTVDDTGEGMSAEVVERIFEPFFTTKDGQPGGGSGLGLAAVHGAVTQAGGEIRCVSSPGTGTRFTVRFPIDEQPDAAQPGDVPLIELAGHGEQILLCDDEPALLRMTTRMFERAGYRVTAVSDPLAALEAYGPQIQLLVTDVQLPHMTGEELAQRMPKELPVVLVSGFAPGDPPPGAILVDKPFTQADLLAAVARALHPA